MGNMWRGFFTIVILVAIIKAPYYFMEIFNMEHNEDKRQRNIGICVLFWFVVWFLLSISGNK